MSAAGERRRCVSIYSALTSKRGESDHLKHQQERHTDHQKASHKASLFPSQNRHFSGTDGTVRPKASHFLTGKK
jgi:hypothetical protein